MGLEEGDLVSTRKVKLLGGESIPERQERVESFFKEHILKHTESREEQKFMVISHYGTIIDSQLVLLKLKDPGTEPKAPFARGLKNCSTTRFDIKLDRETKKITDLKITNDSSYL